jgi:protocatechuate 3,4-dioxygenase beta subunit
MRPHLLAAALAIAVTPALAQLAPTPPQTEGPYYPSRVKPAETDNDLTRIGNGQPAKGDVVRIAGTVVDPAGAPIASAKVEIWQTDSQGIYLHPGDPNTARRDPNFQFYGIATTDAAGAFTFRTIAPARYPGRARHIHAKITPPGGATLTTQFYFKGDGDLDRDGIARSLGKALADVTLDPVKAAGADEATATVRVVIRKPARAG